MLRSTACGVDARAHSASPFSYNNIALQTLENATHHITHIHSAQRAVAVSALDTVAPDLMRSEVCVCVCAPTVGTIDCVTLYLICSAYTLDVFELSGTHPAQLTRAQARTQTPLDSIIFLTLCHTQTSMSMRLSSERPIQFRVILSVVCVRFGRDVPRLKSHGLACVDAVQSPLIVRVKKYKQTRKETRII